MSRPKIKTADRVVPEIYCYTTPEIARHDGWCKIGYTEQEADKRVDQQTHTADVEKKIEWHMNAVYEDGTGDSFEDSDFHAYLTKCGIERKPGTEWFRISPEEAKQKLYEFRENRGVVKATPTVIDYKLRQEQQEARDRARDYFELHEHGEFLFNCKPRFGKTLTVYDLCKTMDFQTVLIVTNRPAIADSWYDDYCKFLGTVSGYSFVSEVDVIKDRPLVLSRSQYTEGLTNGTCPEKCIEFVSLQDLKGSVYFGGQYPKLREVKDMNWDLLVIDEAHEGVDTYKTDIAFDRINRRFTLHLSGTPFKALANDKFPENAIYNWTYADEQKRKAEWHSPDGEKNPYANLPQLAMFTYKMSDIVLDETKKGIDLNGEQEQFAFDLNEFFSTNDKGQFVHNIEVNKFLDALTVQEKFPFSTPELRNELKHTLWLLNRVDSAKALAKKLQQHPVFKDYEIVLAAGDGKMEEDDDSREKALNRVRKAIAEHDKTITISVGQLTTGVTIPEWTAVLMLSSMKSPAEYMQAAFRAQNPCLFHNGKDYYRKERAYVFDFDPARTLIIVEEFANDLASDTANGKGDITKREKNVKELLNFFPVIAEDENGEMMELDAAQVLSIPRKIKSREVVRHGFMSDYLFQNISAVFRAPAEVLEAIKQMTPAKDPGALGKVTEKTGDDLDINDNGEVEIPTETVIGTATDAFGEKVYKPIEDSVTDVVTEAVPEIDDTSFVHTWEKTNSKWEQEQEKRLKDLQERFHEAVTDKIVSTATEKYGSDDLSEKTQQKLANKINNAADDALKHTFGSYNTTVKSIEADRQQAVDQAKSKEEEQKIHEEFDKKREEAAAAFKTDLEKTVTDMTHEAGETTVREVETAKKDAVKRGIEDSVKDHLRGFSRTIPSFLMAYGDDSTTLETFDTIIPDSVFQEVTSITLDQFRFLRDGGDYVSEESGKTEHFDGHLFDPVVFDDSVKEFLHKKDDLADYFETEEDIFDYIPPQKTNQIFTPRNVVVEMCDDLEKENPGCFDDPDTTFADLYMKSGMYLTEIVKRLYRSERMKRLFPDPSERLNHIFAKQVYGLAPTEIIYRICMSYIMGFDKDIHIEKYHIVLCDALKYAQDGSLEKKLKELFPELKNKEVK